MFAPTYGVQSHVQKELSAPHTYSRGVQWGAQIYIHLWGIYFNRKMSAPHIHSSGVQWGRKFMS